MPTATADSVRRNGVSVTERNRAIRQQALREQLASKQLVQQVLEDAKKIAKLKHELSAHDVNRLKIASELRLKLIAKYLPDLKAVEHTGVINHNVSDVSDAELVAVLEAKRVLSADISDAEIVEDTPKQALIEAKSADSIPADIPQCASDAPQGPSRHAEHIPATTTPTTPRKRRSRAQAKPPKVTL